MRRYEWNPAPPTLRQRIVAGVLLAVMLITGASYYLGWGFFGDYDKPAHLVTFLVGLLIFARFMPDVRRT